MKIYVLASERIEYGNDETPAHIDGVFSSRELAHTRLVTDEFSFSEIYEFELDSPEIVYL